MLNRFRAFFSRQDLHTRELISGASVAFIVKALAAGVAFALNVVIARMLGPKGAGVYFLAVTLVTIASTLGRAGMDNTLVRFVAAGAAEADWGKVKGVYCTAIITALGASGALTLGVFVSAPWIAAQLFSDADLAGPLRWMSLGIVPVSLFTLHSSALKGLKRIAESMFVLSILAPFLALLGAVLLVRFMGINGAVWSYVAGAIVTMVVGEWRWHICAPQLRELKWRFASRDLFSSSMPLFWASVFQLVMSWSSTIFLGVFASTEQVGIYNAANRTSLLTNFVLIAVNSIAAPKIAALYWQGELEMLGRLVRNSTKIMTAIAFVPLMIFVFAPKVVMGIFGPQFIKGAAVLTILGLGQFINVATGSVGFLLTMTGHERIWRNIFGFSATLNVVLNILLIPRLGIYGAAIATAISLSLQMLIAVVLVRWKMGILTLPIPVKYFS